jgi:hypothetical protein
MSTLKTTNQITVDNIIIGKEYRLQGNTYNGGYTDGLGIFIPHIHKQDVNRPVTYVCSDRKIVYCQCGRQFLIDNELVIEKVGYETYEKQGRSQ